MPLDPWKIRQYRERQGLTLDEAARRAGFKTRQQWHGIESGGRINVAPDTFLALARALGITMEELMADQETKRKAPPRKR